MQELTVTIERPLGSIGNGEASHNNHKVIDQSAVVGKYLNSHMAKIDTLCNALAEAVEQTGKVQQQIVTEAKDKIGDLAIEIAELVLKDKVAREDYDIETIIANSTENLPDKMDIEVGLNPSDHEMCESIKQKNAASPLSNIKISSDPGVPKAQCRIKTKNGIIESFFKEQLEKISHAIAKSNNQ